MRDQHRKVENFISAQHLGLDFDDETPESSIEGLLQNDLIRDYAAVLHETASSTPEKPRSRAIFILDSPFTDANDYRQAAEALIWKFGTADQHCKDAARLFFGRKGARYEVLGNVLYRDILQEQVIEPYLEARRYQTNGHGPATTPGQERGPGRQALDFVANGAPIGDQRMRAVSAARSYLLAGYSIDDTASALWRGFQAGPQDPNEPWTWEDALFIAEDLERNPLPDMPSPGTNGQHPSESQNTRPAIQINNRFLRDITADAVTALEKSNSPPYLFSRGSELVRLSETSLAADTISISVLKGVLDRCADFVRVKKGEVGEDDVLIPARPPDDVVKDVLSQQRLPFPALKGFASTPVFLPGGRLLACDGYDTASGIYVNLDGLQDLKWDMPLEKAKALVLDELLVDFPFADESSKAHAIAAILEPFIRLMIGGPTPLYLFDAPARGTGKGLLTDMVAVVTTGAPCYAMALPRDDDEVDKRITSTLIAGHQLVLLDNVTVLRSALCRLP